MKVVDHLLCRHETGDLRVNPLAPSYAGADRHLLVQGLAKAAGLFFGSVLVFTYFGEAFNV